MRFTHRIFVDESGDVGPPNTHMVGAVVIAQNHSEIRRLVIETKRKFRKLPKRKVLHAADDPPEVVKFLLTQLQQQKQLNLSVGIFHQEHWWWNRERGSDYAYCQVISETIRRSLLLANIRSNQIEVIVERKFGNKQKNREFREIISSCLDIDASQVTLETKHVARNNRGWTDHLSVADYLAWSYYQQFARDDQQFVEIITDQVTRIDLGIDDKGEVRLIAEDKGGFANL